jgi:hypothetical protein
MTKLDIGDVICTRSEGWQAKMIRFGAGLIGKPNTVNHVAIFMGPGSDGRDRVIEGRPGGVGYKDAKRYLADSWTLNNAKQPKTNLQRAQIATATKALLGTQYDWVGIGQTVMEAINAPDLYRTKSWLNDASPDHVVCSSLADWVYADVGLANPNKITADKITTPGDWAEFIVTRAWEK